MASRPAYLVIDGKVKEELFEFEWHPGMSIQQKQKSIHDLHKSIIKKYPDKKILEISTKSKDKLGKDLSAFNLSVYIEKYKRDISVEMLFQSSKVFENGGPYIDILEGTSLEAKKDPRLKESGDLKYFQFFSHRWELSPKTAFYDWLYMRVLRRNESLVNEIISYDCFTDIEFNPQKSINCQARSAALFVALYRKNNGFDILDNQENYLNELSKFYLEESEEPLKSPKMKKGANQLSLLC